jgi:hypothetical protein
MFDKKYAVAVRDGCIGDQDHEQHQEAYRGL